MVNKLYIDMIPKTSWYNNLRSLLTEKEWNIVKTDVYKKSKFKCSICSEKGVKHPVEAHERWEYNVETGIQKLVDIVSLCPNCHLTTHFGFAQTIGKGNFCKKHLCLINKYSEKDAEKDINLAFEKWNYLNTVQWRVDMSWLIGKYDFSDETVAKLKVLK